MTEEVAQLIEVHEEGEEASESNSVKIQDPKNGQAEKIIFEDKVISSDLQSPFNKCTGEGEEDPVQEMVEELPQATAELKGPGFYLITNKRQPATLEMRHWVCNVHFMVTCSHPNTDV